MDIALSVDRRTVVVVMAILGAQPFADASDDRLARGVGAPALSTSNLSIAGGALFEARYDEGTLGGDLVARAVDRHGRYTPDEYYPIDPDAVGYVAGKEGQFRKFNGLWRAGEVVTAQSRRIGGSPTDDRIIFTAGEDDTGVWSGRRFRWDNTAGNALTESMKIGVNPDTPPDAARDPVVDWTRGYDVDEGTGPEDLRQRRNVLGDLTYAGPVYVGPPNGLTSNAGFDEFRTANTNRTPLVLAGGSDGMLHAFRAGDGSELFAFIPGAALSALKARTSREHSDQPLVGGPIVSGDAFGDFPGCSAKPCWRSVVIAGLGFGGKSIFALDITNPEREMGETDRESNAARKLFLWEFKHDRLGFTTTRPLIAKLRDGTWVVILGNGRGTGESNLFVLDIASGDLLYKIVTPSSGGANGLSSPAGWDSDYDGHIDTVYAGDLEGNLWKFDFSDASGGAGDENGPTIALSGTSLLRLTDPDSGSPLPITTSTLVSITPGGGLIVFFGTKPNHATTVTSSSVYGIRDMGRSWGTNPLSAVHTVAPIYYADPAMESRFIAYRIISSSTVPDSPIGWQLKLPRGEYIVQDPTLNNRRVEFTSSTRVNTDRVDNWFMGVDYQTGQSPASPFLDLNADGSLDAGDTFTDVNNDGDVTKDDDYLPVGRFLGVGIASAPVTAAIAGGSDAVFVTYVPESPGSGGGSNDPGVPGGPLDQDNFDWSPEQFSECIGQKPDGGGSACDATASCWGGRGETSLCHTDGYDDVWNIDGINMLYEGGVVTAPPDVESATGILSSGHKALFHAIRTEQLGTGGSGLREYAASVKDEIRIWIKNPNTVDTPELLDQRILAGLQQAGSETAPPATMYFNCDSNADGIGDNRIVVDAPGFNLLPPSNRTCAIEDITELRVRHNDINALRATSPVCVASNNTAVPLESLGAPVAANPNTPYRNGAFTVQAITTGRRKPPGGGTAMGTSPVAAGVVIWENSNYEHFGAGCAVFNEALRADKIPAEFSGDEPTDGGGDGSGQPDTVVVNGSGESTVTDNIGVAQTSPPDGRVSWREVLE